MQFGLLSLAEPYFIFVFSSVATVLLLIFPYAMPFFIVGDSIVCFAGLQYFA